MGTVESDHTLKCQRFLEVPNFFLYESVEFQDKRMLEGGVRIGYKTDAFDISAFVRNITKDTSAVGGIDFNNLTGFVNEPRVWGVEAGFKF
jgi:iron complex outermembrane receptor protein